MKSVGVFLAWLLATLARVLAPVAVKAVKDAARDTAEDAQPRADRNRRLRERIQARWGGKPPPGGGAVAPAGALALVALLLALSGCGTRTVYVPDGESVRLREAVRAKIWTLDAAGVAVPSVMILPEGWYALPDTPEEDKP